MTSQNGLDRRWRHHRSRLPRAGSAIRKWVGLEPIEPRLLLSGSGADAAAPSFATNEQDPVVLDVLPGDGSAALAPFSMTTDHGGTLTIDPNGTADPSDDRLVYQPAENFSGVDSAVIRLAPIVPTPGQFIERTLTGVEYENVYVTRLDSRDLNHDGAPDLILTLVDDRIVTLLNDGVDGQGNIQFTLGQEIALPAAAQHTVLADVNGDGAEDIVYVAQTPDELRVMWNDGTGRFLEDAAPWPLSFRPWRMIAGDLNGDGADDVLISPHDNGGDPKHILLGDPSGGAPFANNYSAPAPEHLGEALLIDVNADGMLDLVNATSGSLRVTLGAPGGRLEAGTDQYSMPGDVNGSVLPGDFNFDGHLDLAITIFDSATDHLISMFYGRGDGRFDAVHDVHHGDHFFYGDAADINIDGRLDLVTTRYDTVVAMVTGENGLPSAGVELQRPGNNFSGVIADDFDGDGLIDLVAVNAHDATIAVWTGALPDLPALHLAYDVAIEIHVAAVPDAPVALPDTYRIASGQVTTFNVADGVAANDDDADGDAMTVRLLSGPNHGELTLNADGSFTYVSESGFFGSVSFTYELSDGTGLSDTSTVTLRVVHPDQPDIDVYATTEDTPLAIDGISLDGYAVVGPLTTEHGGQFSFDDRGTPETSDDRLIYHPPPDFNGVDAATLRVAPIVPVAGSFTPRDAAGQSPISYANAEWMGVTDLNHDGLPDLIVRNKVGLATLLNEGIDDEANSTFAQSQTIWPTHLNSSILVDLNGDGADDIVAVKSGPIELMVFWNDGAGQFVEDTTRWPIEHPSRRLTAGDVNGDGAVDLLVGGDSNTEAETWFVGNASGEGSAFSDYFTLPVERTVRQTLIVDVNGDGLDDVVRAGQGFLTVSISEGDMRFASDPWQYAAPGQDYGTLLHGDFNADGIVDLALTIFDSSPQESMVSIFHGLGDGRFEPHHDLLHSEHVFFADAADLNLDGRTDLITTRFDTLVIATMRPDGLPGAYVEWPLANRNFSNVAARDFDGDGVIDLAALDLNDGLVYMWTGNPVATPALSRAFNVPIEVIVVPEPDAPVGVEDVYRVDSGQLAAIGPAAGVLANDYDVDGDALIAALLTRPMHGQVTFENDGSFTYTSTPGYHGVDTFTYEVIDSTGRRGGGTVVLKVIDPTLVDPLPVDDAYEMRRNRTLVVPDSQGVLANDVPLLGDAMSATLIEGPEHGQLVLDPGGGFTYYPDDDFVGEDRFVYTPHYALGISEPAIVTITVNAGAAESPPVAQPDHYTVAEDTQLVVEPRALPRGEPVGTNLFSTAYPRYALDAANGHRYWEDDGTVYRSNLDGHHEVAIIGGLGYIGDAGVALDLVHGRLYVAGTHGTYMRVWRANLDGSDVRMILNQGSGWVEDIQYMALDIPAGHLYINDGGPGSVRVNLDGSGVEAIGYFDFEDFDAIGRYVAADLESTLISGGSYWRSSDATTAGDDWATATYDDSAWPSAPAPGVSGASAPEQHAGTMLYRRSFFVRDPASITNLVLMLQRQDGAVVYLNGAQVVRHNVLETASRTDPAIYDSPTDLDARFYGFEIDPSLLSAGRNTIAVEVHRAAGAQGDGGFDLRLTAGRTAIGGLLENDASASQGVMSIVLVGGPTHGTLVLGAGGLFTYKPAANFNGVDTFTYAAMDEFGAGAPVEVRIDVTAVNDAPTITSGLPLYTIFQGQTLVVDAEHGALTVVSDIDGDALTARLSASAGGLATVNPDGSFEYRRSGDFTGTDRFRISVSDGIASASMWVNVRVVLPPDAKPIAMADAYEAFLDFPLIVPSSKGVLKNDTDIRFTGLDAVLVTTTAHGTLQLESNGAFTYEAGPGFDGIDSFTYQPSDGVSLGEAVTVTIDVLPYPRPAPLGVPNGYATPLNRSLNGSSSRNVLANDVNPAGDPLTALLVEGPLHGTLTLNADGTFKYTPNHDFIGTDSFLYRPTDGYLTGEPTLVSVVVGEETTVPPVGVGDYYLIPSGQSISSQPSVLANDIQPTQTVLTAELIEGPSHGAVMLQSNGTFTYQPELGFWGFDSFVYRPVSSTLAGESTRVVLHVAAPPSTPLTPDPSRYATQPDQSLTVLVGDGLLRDISLAAHPWFNVTSMPVGDNLTRHVVTLLEVEGLPINAIDVDVIATVPGTLSQQNPAGLPTIFADYNSAFVIDPDADVNLDTQFMIESAGLLAVLSAPHTYEDASVLRAVMANFPSAPFHGELIQIVLPRELTARVVGEMAAPHEREFSFDFIVPQIIVAQLLDAPSHGELTLNEDGSFQYTPEPGFIGTDQFTYRAVAAGGLTQPTLVAIDVLPGMIGDANVDGRVDVEDLRIVASMFGQPGHWHDGDFDCDGMVTIRDMAMLSSHFGEGETTGGGSIALNVADELNDAPASNSSKAVALTPDSGAPATPTKPAWSHIRKLLDSAGEAVTLV